MANIPSITIALLGSAHSGKSTLAGQLLYKYGVTDIRAVQQSAALSISTTGSDSYKFAWLVDTLEEEHSTQATLQSHHMTFADPNLNFALIDTPSSLQHVHQTVTSLAQSSAAILVVSADRDEFDGAFKDHLANAAGQLSIAQLFRLATHMGIERFIVAVNKIDQFSRPDEQEARFTEIKNEILGISKQNRPPDAGMTFVPISGWAGSNLIDNKNFPWFKIPTLSMAMDYLWPDSATKMTRTDRWYSAAANRPLRLFVQEARQEGGNTTVIGVLACGSLTPGMKLQSDPGSNISQLLSFKRYGLDGNIEPGNLVQLTLSGSATGMVRGAVCSAADHEPAAEAASIIAEITVFGGAHSPLHAGSRMLLSCHTATIPCEVKKLVAVLNTRTGQKVEDFPPSLDSSNRRRGLVEITPLEPIAIEPCIEFSRIGRFALSYLAPAESEEYTEADYADMPVREELMQKGMIFKEEDGEVTAWPDGLVALGKVVEVVKKKAGPRV